MNNFYFTTVDFLMLKRAIEKNCNNLDVRINKVGNLTIDGFNEKFTLRVHKNGEYIWSRYNYLTGYSHPMHMVNRKIKNYEWYDYKYLKKEHNMNMYTFSMLDDAINYIVNYFKRYRKIYYKN